jgi:hypothetical protein
MQHTASGAAHLPALHHVASAWAFPLGHGQHTGAQSSGLEQGAPASALPHWYVPVTEAQVLSTFSPAADTELGAVAVTGPELQVATGGAAPVLLLLQAATAIPASRRAPIEP